METLKKLSQSLVKAFTLLRQNHPLILASSTAFFATFSISPIIIILVNVLSLYFQSENITDKLFHQIRTIFGDQTARQIESIVNNFRSFSNDWWITVAGFVFLIFVATTLLNIIKQAIHQLWQIKKRPANKVTYNLAERSKAFAIILFIGLLFILSLLFDTSIAVLRGYLQDIIPSIDVWLIRLINIVFSILVVTAWFTILFKFLPDAKIQWKVALVGGFLTSLLFNLGKLVLGKLLVYSNIVTIFGASTSIALLLLFIFYSSFIIYYGASFTFEYGAITNRPIEAGKYGEKYEVKVIQDENQTR